MDYNERKIITRDHFDHPVSTFILGISVVALGFSVNAVLNGDTGEYSLLGLIPMIIGVGVIGLSTESMGPTTREYVASGATVAMLVVALLVSFSPPYLKESIQALLNGTIIAALISMAWSMRDWFVTWYYNKKTPEERVLEE